MIVKMTHYESILCGVYGSDDCPCTRDYDCLVVHLVRRARKKRGGKGGAEAYGAG